MFGMGTGGSSTPLSPEWLYKRLNRVYTEFFNFASITKIDNYTEKIEVDTKTKLFTLVKIIANLFFVRIRKFLLKAFLNFC